MAWTTPVTANSGEVLTADRYNVEVVANSVMGNPVYTNEAARDAAITAPSEGMRVYLTAPTVPAATGSSATYVPSGVQTIYNGSVWVCVTEVGSFAAPGGPPQTSSTSYVNTLTNDATALSVTLVTGTTAMIGMNLRSYVNNTSQYGYASIAVSGATTLAASDTNAVILEMGSLLAGRTGAQIFILGGLTAGTNTFTMSYRVSGNTYIIDMRRLWAKGIA
jgi:hypothetical protein